MTAFPDLQVWLDESTLEELQPPCEGAKRENCPDPAEWAIHWHCDSGHREVSLYCNGCRETLMEWNLAHALVCRLCKRTSEVEVVAYMDYMEKI